MAYPNLEAELKRRGITRVRMAEDLRLAISTICARLTGKSPISMQFAKEIKQAYGIDIPLDVLFEESKEAV